MAHSYTCPSCNNTWDYEGDTCTTFRDGGKQTWNKDKTVRIDTCECGTEGTYNAIPLSEKRVAVSFKDNGTGKTYTK